MTAIEVEQLHKSYGAFEAVRGVSFSVPAGGSVAVLGPNGAGKTTTIEILEGYRKPTSGTVSVLGTDPASGGQSLRVRVGIVLQEAGFPLELTVAELVDVWRRYYPNPLLADEVIETVGLTERRHVRTKYLSGGEHRRLDLALGIVGRPEVLFLDEPTTGFDPSARRTAWEVISALVRGGLTLLLTTHYLEEARALTERILIMAGGQIVADGAPDDIGRERALGRISFVLPQGLSTADLPRLPEGSEVRRIDQAVAITARDPLRTSHAVTSWALKRGVKLETFRVEPPSLEDAYLAIVSSTRGSTR
jgi:ABC-2 type transport system ATP-binding protein